MAFNDGPHPALLIDDVLEKILEFAASGEPFKNTSNLRTVCKQWREMSFKGLCQSTSLPAIGLRNNKNGRCGSEIKFETFRQRFPRTCPTHIALSEPRLPIQMKIGRLPLPQDVADIREFSRAITSITVYPVNRLNENVTYDFKLPNLRSIVVSWKPTNFEPWQRFVNYVLDASNCDVVLKYVNVSYDRSKPNTWPVALPTLRDLEWSGPAMDLQRFTTPTLNQLVRLKLMLEKDGSTPDPIAESAALTEILARHSSTLQKAEITHLSYRPRPVKTLRLPRGQLPQLLTLESSIPILLSKDKSNPTNMPKLKNLKYIVGYHPLEESDGFQVSHFVSNSLVKLRWCWRISLPAEEDQEETNRETEIVREFEEEYFPVYPELMELNIDNMSFPIALALMPKVFNFMTNLTHLSVDFVQTPGTSGDETVDLLKILTGSPSGYIPTDPTLWPGNLKDNTNAITNLKHLSNLRIHTSNSTERVFGRFIFYAAFFQMQKLTMLKLSGCISVEWDMIIEWRSAGREIDAHGVHFGNQDSD